MCIDCVARNVIDQIGFENYGPVLDVYQEEAQTRGQDLLKLLGVLLCMKNCDSGSFQSPIEMILGQKKGSGNRCASRQGGGPNKKISAGKAHSVTPNASNARC